MLKRLIWVMGIFCAGVTHAEEADVYTGVLAYANSSRVTLTRIFIIPRPHSDTPEVHMNHYLGGFDSNEVIPTYFDTATRQADGTLVLTDKRSQTENPPYRVPTLFLKISAEGGIEGDYVSTEDGIAGKLSLTKGWSLRPEMTKEKTISPSFSGEYMAFCRGFGNLTVVQLMELVATRFESRDMALIPGADLTVKAVNYLGALACAPTRYPDAVETSCGAFDRGNYDHYKNRLNLHVSLNWQYSCEVSEKGDLNCEGPRRQSCEFTRYVSESSPKLDTVGKAPPFKLPEQKITPPPSATPSVTPSASAAGFCDELNGVTDGLMRHGFTGLYQRIRLESRTVEGDAEGEKGCQMVGSLRQFFNKSDERTVNPLTHVLSNSWYFPTTGKGRIGASRVGGDAQISIWKDGEFWRGIWYSTLNGYVGDIVFSKHPQPELMASDASQWVPSLPGVFVQEPQHGIDVRRTVSIIGYPDTSDTSSFDPFRQVKLTGNLETTVYDNNNDPGFSYIAAVDTITYNYFTGVATFIGPSGYFYARVSQKGLDMKVITRKLGGNYMKPWWTWDFVRQ